MNDRVILLVEDNPQDEMLAQLRSHWIRMLERPTSRNG
jgi:hypothetical protein